jgi:DNA-binding CsgD family transcriptional regulator
MIAYKNDFIERQIPDLSVVAKRYKLTPREVEVAELLILGKADKSISRDIGISIFTVREHMRHIRRKMGVFSRLEVVSLLLM